MSMHRPLFIACLLLLGGGKSWAQKATTPPNILVLVADDLGWNGVSYHNSKMITPNLAKLAKEGCSWSASTATRSAARHVPPCLPG